MVTFPFSGPGPKWRRKKNKSALAVPVAQIVSPICDRHSHTKKNFLFGCQWQPRNIWIVLCIYAEFPNFGLNMLWIWRSTNSRLNTTNRGKKSQWVRNGPGYNSLFSVGFGSFPVSQKRPVESWTEGLAVRVKLCKACAGAGTGGVWMQSSAKCRNWWMDLSHETPSTETSLIRAQMYSTCSDACLSLRGMKEAHVCSRPPCSVLGQKTVGEMHRWLYLILWEESDQRDWRDGAFRPPPPFGKFSCANCKMRAMAHQHACQDNEDLIKYKTCNICLWLKIRWLECYVLPHGI